jgi:deoxyribodipyrimidine photolyase-related protein
VPLDILPDDRFLCSHAEFDAWAEGRRELRMEYFYRDMRRRHGILMEPDGEPAGGRWNFDAENRKPPAAGLDAPRRVSFRKDAITLAVLDLVRRRFADGYGRLEPFHFAVTRRQARELDHFVAGLPGFGAYQDAWSGEPSSPRCWRPISTPACSIRWRCAAAPNRPFATAWCR